jgi:hypothetical protein
MVNVANKIETSIEQKNTFAYSLKEQDLVTSLENNLPNTLLNNISSPIKNSFTTTFNPFNKMSFSLKEIYHQLNETQSSTELLEIVKEFVTAATKEYKIFKDSENYIKQDKLEEFEYSLTNQNYFDNFILELSNYYEFSIKELNLETRSITYIKTIISKHHKKQIRQKFNDLNFLINEIYNQFQFILSEVDFILVLSRIPFYI